MLPALDIALALRAAPLFADIEAELLLPLAALCTTCELGAGELLFAEGELGDSLYVVVRGAVQVQRDGREIASLGAGECVGEMAALDCEPRSATIVAAAPTLLVRLDRNDLLDLLRDEPALIRSLARVLADRLHNRP
jgi:CRP-like cAMP-binding protein